MYEQSFSQKNLRRILEDENKKGKYLEGEYFSNVAELSKEVKNARQALLRVRKKKNIYSKIVYEDRRNKVLSIIKNRKKIRSDEIDKELLKVASNISKKSFFLSITQGADFSRRPTFRLGNTAEEFFAGKQLQKNITRAFEVRQLSRHLIVPQLAAVLNNNLPKIVIRTDVSSFYESLNHEVLFSLIKKENALSLSSKKMLGKFLSDYCLLTGVKGRGVPRGIGVSAPLSEIYMSELDAKLRCLDNLIYYARYVDDIVLVFFPATPNATDTYNYVGLIESAMNESCLKMNKDKTKLIDFSVRKKETVFDFLGYEFHMGKGVSLDLSRRKRESYQEKIDIVFDKFMNGNQSRKDERILIDRMRFLTGNTKLTNNKGGAFVGIYFSNKFITNDEGLHFLDNYYHLKLNALTKISLRRRLSKLSFKDGFVNKSFRNFTAKELSKITRIWKL